MDGGARMIPVRFDLSALVTRSVATFYSQLVTRPTGQALRLGIEGQLCEVSEVCLSVLDFSDVVILDYSCADEVVAKLLHRYQRADRPGEAYFVARGLAERHRETIEAVLERYGLALVAELREGGAALLGQVPEQERHAWGAVERLRSARLDQVAGALGTAADDATRCIDALSHRRVVLCDAGGTCYALTAFAAPLPNPRSA
jgi:hypothetical protein